ncbi:alanine or glycine:cation symporter, AGCS family [Sphingomonas laterariae]|uniref:Alanine or glycine:cation symporter, AGCS family n=1 Tax=Edaphosphingomonas laterariae TaxID=861865 RepID=A0A239HA63_9SPHN|nr:amino acid carrier protein [Sphingomonas laterariae]SNS78289.1 alanine or glycine:cation symporter, AGCS family [Sphingomonas laterariae]
MIETLSHWIDALAAFVFWKIPFFGTQIEAIVLWLAVPMLFFTLWLGVPQITGFRFGLRALRGHYADPAHPGEMSQFAALATALSGTLGLGNIAGVAIAIAAGGPGAAFWLFIIGLFAMALKCAEVTLGLKYREFDDAGRVRGGPMYVMKNGLKARGWPRIGAAIGTLYAVFALGGAIPLVQVNQSYAQVSAVVGADFALEYGIGLALAVSLVVVGGARWLGRVTVLLVPAMSLLYLLAALAIIIHHRAELPAALLTIISDAFTGKAAAGGAIGAFVIGMRRAVYSCEAGVGSAVIAHAAARTREPASEGLVALLEPFIDTVVVCSLTALMIVVSGVWDDGFKDISMASAAFAGVISWFPNVLAVAVVLFAYSTLIAWGYYGGQAWAYLFGPSRTATIGYRLLYCLLLPIGALLDISRVINLIDSAFFLMALPNVLMLYVFAPEVRREIRGYIARKSGAAAEPATA